MITKTRSGLIGNCMTGLAAALLLTIGCAGEDGRQGVQGPAGPSGDPGPSGPGGTSGELDPTLSTWGKALAGIGGEEALDGLEDFRVEASGLRHILDEGYHAGDEAATVSSFDTTVTYNLALDAFRVDWSRNILFIGGVPLTYSEIVNQELGYVEGDDSFFGPAASTTDMPSSRWAAVRKQTMLLHPHVIYKAVATDPSIASEAGAGLFNGSIHERLRVEDPNGLPALELWINASTGRLAKISTMENDHLHRDVHLEVFYTDWQDDADGVSFPLGVFVAIEGQLVHEEYRSLAVSNPGEPATTYDFPAGAAPTYDEDLAAFGRASHQWNHSFLSLGLPLDTLQTNVQATELAPGYWLLASSHNSVIVEPDDSLVLLATPLSPERSEAIQAWAETQFPGKPISHVVVTHHHQDHSAGVRTFAAAGATIIVGAPAAEAYSAIFRAPSTVWPDALSANPVQPDIRPVEDSLTLADATNPVEIHHFPNLHSDDALMAYVPSANMVFESDLWNPDPTGGSALFPAAAADLLDGINDTGVYNANLVVVGGHGASASVSVLEDFVAANTPNPVP